ncbi:hypothetical protein SESBI_30081 [Sesbania bispinosa]|nr:hypothetical protein SESBI_30081 [Sesbania bispinosa]
MNDNGDTDTIFSDHTSSENQHYVSDDAFFEFQNAFTLGEICAEEGGDVRKEIVEILNENLKGDDHDQLTKSGADGYINALIEKDKLVGQLEEITMGICCGLETTSDRCQGPELEHPELEQGVTLVCAKEMGQTQSTPNLNGCGGPQEQTQVILAAQYTTCANNEEDVGLNGKPYLIIPNQLPDGVNGLKNPRESSATKGMGQVECDGCVDHEEVAGPDQLADGVNGLKSPSESSATRGLGQIGRGGRRIISGGPAKSTQSTNEETVAAGFFILQSENLCEVPVVQVEDALDIKQIITLAVKKKGGRPRRQVRGRKRSVNVVNTSLSVPQSGDDSDPLVVAQKICDFGKQVGVVYRSQENEVVNKLVEMELRDARVMEIQRVGVGNEG